MPRSPLRDDPLRSALAVHLLGLGAPLAATTLVDAMEDETLRSELLAAHPRLGVPPLVACVAGSGGGFFEIAAACVHLVDDDESVRGDDSLENSLLILSLSGRQEEKSDRVVRDTRGTHSPERDYQRR